MADLAAQPGLRNRQIEAYFMEQDPATFNHSRAVLEEDTAGIRWEAWPGRVEDHLDDLFAATTGVSLFLFLDPYGHGLTMDHIVAALAARENAAATEALIRIDAPGFGEFAADCTKRRERDERLHRDGMTVFNELLSLATRAWRRSVFELAIKGLLFDGDLVDSELDEQEKKLRSAVA